MSDFFGFHSKSPPPAVQTYDFVPQRSDGVGSPKRRQRPQQFSQSPRPITQQPQVPWHISQAQAPVQRLLLPNFPKPQQKHNQTESTKNAIVEYFTKVNFELQKLRNDCGQLTDIVFECLAEIETLEKRLHIVEQDGVNHRQSQPPVVEEARVEKAQPQPAPDRALDMSLRRANAIEDMSLWKIAKVAVTTGLNVYSHPTQMSPCVGHIEHADQVLCDLDNVVEDENAMWVSVRIQDMRYLSLWVRLATIADDGTFSDPTLTV